MAGARAPSVSLAPKTPFPFPFKRLPRRLDQLWGFRFELKYFAQHEKNDSNNVMLLARAHKYLAKHGKLNQQSQTSVSFYFFNRYKLMGANLKLRDKFYFTY